VVQWQVARARARAADQNPIDLLGAAWGPWWSFRRGRRIPAPRFRPAPSVDAGVLTVTRREPALLPKAAVPRYREFVRARFGDARGPRSVADRVRRFRADR
jgi:23S rRNA (adenine-N6)-dimethyltransferase